MSKVFITGSADGLGKIAAKLLADQGHQVVLHARNQSRAKHAMDAVAGAEAVLTGDLSRMDEIINLAEDANSIGIFDAVIHNAGVYRVSNHETFMVNSLAPYILTCRMKRAPRLIYLSSGLHTQGDPYKNFSSYESGKFNYADTKLHVVMLARAITLKWPGIYANAVNPGWVPTKMGGAWAPDNLKKGAETQVWLAVSDDPEALVSGGYFFHKQQKPSHPASNNTELQEKYLDMCCRISGIKFEI